MNSDTYTFFSANSENRKKKNEKYENIFFSFFSSVHEHMYAQFVNFVLFYFYDFIYIYVEFLMTKCENSSYTLPIFIKTRQHTHTHARSFTQSLAYFLLVLQPSSLMCTHLPSSNNSKFISFLVFIIAAFSVRFIRYFMLVVWVQKRTPPMPMTNVCT